MISFRRHILPNGLRIIHHYDGSTKMTALNLLYDVGSKDESPERTGFAHLFEHLMFGGSVNIPDFDTPLQKAGGENNAWTSNDVTNYYTVVPTHNAETAFWLESDRMLSLAFSSEFLSVQKQVVIEEFKQRNLNQPYGDSFLLLRPMAYRVHPYRWPVIGKNTSHIGNASLEEVKEFFFAHYAPNNAILSISGSLPFDEAILLCEKWFAPISRREVACRDLPQEPVQTKPHKKIVEREVPLDAIFKAYHMVDRKHPDYQGYDALSDVLASGRSSRLYRRLVMEKKLFTEIDSSITGDIEPGLFLLKGKLSPGISLEQGEEAIEMAKKTEYDIVLLDVMLPKHDGFEVCQAIREFSDMPVIMLTAKGSDMDKILGLEYGADDYISKPFNILEVKARIRAIIRRSMKAKRQKKEEQANTYIGSGDLKMDTEGRRVFIGEKEINLTAKEFDLLELLVRNPNKVYSREALLNYVWGNKAMDSGDVRTVDVHVRRLREKIEPSPSDPKFVHTKWGVGYYFQAK